MDARFGLIAENNYNNQTKNMFVCKDRVNRGKTIIINNRRIRLYAKLGTSFEFHKQLRAENSPETAAEVSKGYYGKIVQRCDIFRKNPTRS